MYIKTYARAQKKMEEDFSNFREIQKTSMQNLNENLKKLEHHQESSRDTIDHVHRTLSINNSEFSKIISGQLHEYKKDYLSEINARLTPSHSDSAVWCLVAAAGVVFVVVTRGSRLVDT